MGILSQCQCCAQCGKVVSCSLPVEQLAELPERAAAFGWVYDERGFCYCSAECRSAYEEGRPDERACRRAG